MAGRSGAAMDAGSFYGVLGTAARSGAATVFGSCSGKKAKRNSGGAGKRVTPAVADEDGGQRGRVAPNVGRAAPTREVGEGGTSRGW
jgi:hypothetical protein